MCRVLFVLGGAVAATAIGWLISSATASADTLPVPPVAPVVDVLASAGVPAKPADLPIALPDTVTRTLRQIGDHVPVDPAVVAPALTALSPAPVSTPAPGGQSTPAGGRTHARTLPGPAAVTARPTPSGPAVARHVARPPAGHLLPIPRPVPTAPTSPTPWPPAGVPAAPSGGLGSTGPGGVGFADAQGTPLLPRGDVVRVVPATAAPRHPSAGRQPGSTPD